MDLFPAPDFESDDEELISPAQLPGVPVERPFFTMRDRVFDTPCQRSLQYDSGHPVYSTPSCKVYIARTLADPPIFYALKASTYVRRIRHENEMYQMVGDFPTIISCFDMWMSKGSAFLQLELAEMGSIRQRLFEYTPAQVWAIFAHIASALDFLHSKNVMHLDVSPANILESGGVFKLADFGTALKFGEFAEDCEGAGPYVSPEALAYPSGRHPVGAATDIFCFGVLMMELLGKKLAPRGASSGYPALRRGEYDLGFISEEFAFVKDMLNPDPSRRPTAAALCRMPRVRAEMKLIAKDGGQLSPPAAAATPVAPTNKLPPETPYAARYSGKGRRIMFDDEFL